MSFGPVPDAFCMIAGMPHSAAEITDEPALTRYATVPLTGGVSHLTEDERQALELMIRAMA